MSVAGASPRRRLGQHFLQDHEVLAEMVQVAEVSSDDRVLEVGPGPGILTRHLLAAGAEVDGVEIDPAMQKVARALIEPELSERLHWHEGDAMEGTRRVGKVLAPLIDDATAFVSNLPYSIAGPLLAAIVSRDEGPKRLVVMVQSELAERLMSPPGRKTYGPLSVVMSLGADVTRIRRVSPGAFWPRPKVFSSVLRIEKHPGRPTNREFLQLDGFLASAFHNRRKTIVNSIAQAEAVSPEEVKSCLCLDKKSQKSRAEVFSGVELRSLAQRWAGNAPGERDRP